MEDKREKGATRGSHVDITSTMRWDELVLSKICHEDQVVDAKALISSFSGYLPSYYDCLPFLPFIQALISQYKSGQLGYDVFLKELNFHIRNLRNTKFKKEWWIVKEKYDDVDHKIYNTELVAHRDHARSFFDRMLGYTPDLEYSLHVEMLLRRLYNSDTKSIIYHNDVELFALAAARYREVLLKEGQEAADNSQLLGVKLCQDMGECPIHTYVIKKIGDENDIE